MRFFGFLPVLGFLWKLFCFYYTFAHFIINCIKSTHFNDFFHFTIGVFCFSSFYSCKLFFEKFIATPELLQNIPAKPITFTLNYVI